MGDFTDRVMGALNDDDGDKERAERAALPHGTERMRQEGMGEGVGEHGIDEIGEGPEELQPCRAGGKDDWNFDLVPYKCHRCGVLDHVNPHLADIYQRRGILCLPCQSPHLFKWKRDVEDGTRYLFPDPRGKKPPSRLGEPERRALENRATEMVDLKLRRDYLHETILKMQDELSNIEPRIAALVLDGVPRAQAALLAIETDPKLAKRQEAADLAHEIALLTAALSKKNKKRR